MEATATLDVARPPWRGGRDVTDDADDAAEDDAVDVGGT